MKFQNTTWQQIMPYFIKGKAGLNIRKVIIYCLFLIAFYHANAQQPQKNFVLRTMDWGYRIIEGDSAHPRKSVLLPIPIVAYKPETRWILGVSMNAIFRVNKDSITRPSGIRFNISYSQNKQLALIPEWNIFTQNNKWNIRGNAKYTSFGENFYGIGKDAPFSNKELYSFKMYRTNLKVAYQFNEKLDVAVSANLQNRSRLDNEYFSFSSLIISLRKSTSI
jgi:hypothetical protein